MQITKRSYLKIKKDRIEVFNTVSNKMSAKLSDIKIPFLPSTSQRLLNDNSQSCKTRVKQEIFQSLW